jgi:hypothetical protein
MDKISPAYLMMLIQRINDRLFELYSSYENVAMYLERWHEVYDCLGDNENFYFVYKDNERQKLDTKKTLAGIDGEMLLKIAIDLNIETPDYIPSIPTFKNALKSSYETASQTFDKAFKNVEVDPSLAIGLANSALESIIKEMLKDTRIKVERREKETLSNLVKDICKAFKMTSDANFPGEIKTIANSLLNACKSIEDLRSDKTIFHGKTDDSYIVNDPVYAYFVINTVTTVGLFLLNYYKLKYPPITQNIVDNDLPF